VLKRIVLGLAALIVAVGGYFAWKFRPQVEEIPEELEQVEDTVDHLAVKFRAQGPLPELTLRDLNGKTAFFVIEGKESMQSSEGTQIKRALNRWIYPENVTGFMIGDADGAGLLAKKIEDTIVKHMRDETKWPIYLDFDGAMISTFKLPKGHFGLVVLGPEGEIQLRHSGDADEAKLAEIRELLGATEPAAPPEAPEFSVAGLDRTSCREKGCVFVFLDGPLARTDIPGIEGGFEGETDETFAKGKEPNVRNVGLVRGGWELEGTGIRGVIVGKLTDLDVEHLEVVESAPELREAFDVGEDEAAMVIVKDDEIAFLEKGRIPFWKFGLAGDVLGIQAKDPGEHGGDEDSEEEGE
jgi:hypothetical protein